MVRAISASGTVRARAAAGVDCRTGGSQLRAVCDATCRHRPRRAVDAGVAVVGRVFASQAGRATTLVMSSATNFFADGPSPNVTRCNQMTLDGRQKQHSPPRPGSPPKNTGVSTWCEYHTKPPGAGSRSPTRRSRTASWPLEADDLQADPFGPATHGQHRPHASRAGDRARTAYRRRRRCSRHPVTRCAARRD